MDEFERCWPWLDASLASFGRTHTKEQVFARIASGHAQMWTSEGGVIVGQVVTHPIGWSSFNIWLQGGELEHLKPMHPPIEAWARTHGCHRMTAWGRDGWLRVLDGWENCGTRRAKWLLEPPPEWRGTKC